MKIKYIGFYQNEKNKENRISTASAMNKMDYITSKLNQIGFEVDIISPSWTNNKKFYKYKKLPLNRNNKLILPITIPWLKYLKPLSVLISQFWLFIYLILNTKKGENLIVYHSLWLMYPLYVAKKIKKFKLILEVEEIYQDARKVSKINSLLEHKTINLADKYIFPTSLLNDKINSQSKGHTILYGTYKIEERRVSNFSDGKIHIVYAGTFDPNKGGVQTAIEIAPHLSNNYHLHIMGFGSSSQLKETIKQITKTSELSECEITYEGELKGKEYVSFLQKCHIGLSTQRPDADFNKTSFPSKVFSYLVNGLRVVSIKLEVLSLSPVDSIIYYSQSSSSESLAKAIMSIDVTERYNSSKLINMLDNKFEKELEDLIGIING